MNGQTSDRELMQQALDAYNKFDYSRFPTVKALENAMDALRARLAQPEPPCKTGSQCVGGKCQRCDGPEPVAYLYVAEDGYAYFAHPDGYYPDDAKPLYTAPPRKEWCQCEDAPNDCTYEKNCRVPQIDAAFKRIEWQGLTDEERYLNDARTADELEYARAIEAKLKEKNA